MGEYTFTHLRVINQISDGAKTIFNNESLKTEDIKNRYRIVRILIYVLIQMYTHKMMEYLCRLKIFLRKKFPIM